MRTLLVFMGVFAGASAWQAARDQRFHTQLQNDLDHAFLNRQDQRNWDAHHADVRFQEAQQMDRDHAFLNFQAQRDADLHQANMRFRETKQHMQDVARMNFDMEKNVLQTTRDHHHEMGARDARQISCEAFAGRVHGMGHLNEDRKEQVIQNFFARMGRHFGGPEVWHCTEGPSGACYESDGPHVANFRYYSQDYNGWKAFCSSWRSHHGTFNGGVGRC